MRKHFFMKEPEIKSMKYMFISLFIFFAFAQKSQAQVTITPAQYYVTIQSTQPAVNYQNLTNISYSRLYTFKDEAGTITTSTGWYGTGLFSKELYIIEANKPATISLAHSINYQIKHCENYDPNCDGGIGVVRANGPITQTTTKNVKKNYKIGSTMIQEPNPDCGYCWYESGSSKVLDVVDIPIRYPNFDTTIVNEGNSVTISIRQASDNNYNLPSSDLISINSSSSDGIDGFVWQYQLFNPSYPGDTIWHSIPSALIYNNNNDILVSGEALFGSSWMSNINKTVLFRMRNSSTGLTSNILIYTHRLSSPKIVSVESFQNPCYGYDTAYIKIKFDRALITNEKINIFLEDTTSRLNYSALNLSNAEFDGSTNTYTWKRELVRGGYKIALIGKYFDFATYTGSPKHFAMVNVTDPEPLRLYLSQIPVSCFDGDNGKINVGAKGGVGNFKYELQLVDSSFSSAFTNFNNPVYNSTYGTMDQSLMNMRANVYKVRLRDGNNCMIRDSLGNEIYRTITVKQPETPLTVSSYLVSPITAYENNDGAISIGITGGTPNVRIAEDPNYSKYRFEWRDSTTGALITNFTVDTTGKFVTKISNLPSGTYKFKAWDASFDPSTTNLPSTLTVNSRSSNTPAYYVATSQIEFTEGFESAAGDTFESFILNQQSEQIPGQQGCFILMYIKITRPEPLNVNIAVDSAIRCYGDSKGKLKAIPSGGIPITVDSVRYHFTWYKNVNGTYVNLNVNDSIISNAGAGEYKVEISDKYNHVKSYTYNFVQPTVITATVTSTQSSCYFTPDGTMSVTASGGTAPYSYEWSSGHLTQTVPNVAGGTYVVVIRDANLCNVTQQVVVTSPAKINTIQNVTPVGCNGSSSGAISLSVSGGSGGYTYLWSNGSTGTSLNNLSAGTYWYRVTDTKGCYDSATIDLDIPEAYTINAGPDRKICNGQVIDLKVENDAPWLPLVSSWNGPQGIVNGNKISVSTPGTYIATVANASGCQKKDTVTVTAVNASVNTSFTISTQAFAGENTTLVNISPAEQDSTLWLMPTGTALTLVSQSKYYCEVKFADTGRYVVGMRAYYSNGCVDEKYKDVNVVSKQNFPNMGSQSESFLKKFGIMPNPTTGNFTLSLEFSNITVARVRIINLLTNVTISDRSLSGAANYSEQYNVGIVPAATYVVLIETPKGNFVHKLVKQ